MVGSAHGTPRRPRHPQTPNQLLQLRPLRRLNQIIRIKPKRIITRGTSQRRIPSGPKIIDPHEIKHPRPERSGDFNRAILTSRIQHNNLIKQPPHRCEATRQVILLVPGNHRQAHAAWAGSARGRQRCVQTGRGHSVLHGRGAVQAACGSHELMVRSRRGSVRSTGRPRSR